MLTYAVNRITRLEQQRELSAYVSIRQHTSAYVSIRQHTPSALSQRLEQQRELFAAKTEYFIDFFFLTFADSTRQSSTTARCEIALHA